MARKQEVIVTLTDDLDGSTKGIETLAFSVEGAAYEIDLGPKNAKAFRSDLGKWTAHARKAKRIAAPKARRAMAGSKTPSEAGAIRAWATENGVDVPARGRVPAAVVERYKAR